MEQVQKIYRTHCHGYSPPTRSMDLTRGKIPHIFDMSSEQEVYILSTSPPPLCPNYILRLPPPLPPSHPLLRSYRGAFYFPMLKGRIPSVLSEFMVESSPLPSSPNPFPPHISVYTRLTSPPPPSLPWDSRDVYDINQIEGTRGNHMDGRKL